MSTDGRIHKLEQEIGILKDNFEQYAKTHQHILGESEAYRAAVIALIATHPDPDILAGQLHQHLSRPEAAAVFQSNSEERLQGLQAAQSYLLDVCDIARRLHRKPE
jgi:hypothetical protein